MIVLIAPASEVEAATSPWPFVFRHQQLDADPEQQQRADYLEPGYRQQLQGEEDQHDAQANGTHDAPENPLLALIVGQLAAGQCNYHSVVAAEEDIDQDDLQYRDPECGGRDVEHEWVGTS